MIFDKKLLINFKNNSEKLGLKPAIEEFFNKLGVTEISSNGNIPKKGPLLIISNHPGIFDTLVLFSKADRDDLFFIALEVYGVLGNAVRTQLLPIYRKSKYKQKIYEYALDLESGKTLIKELPKQEVFAKNKATISKAAELINKGNTVSIFPTGSVGKSLDGSKWKPGIGFLIKEIKNPDTRIVFVKIEGTKKSEAFSYMSPVLRKLFYRPQPILVSFSNAFLLTGLVDQNDSAKEIAAKIEKNYLIIFS